MTFGIDIQQAGSSDSVKLKIRFSTVKVVGKSSKSQEVNKRSATAWMAIPGRKIDLNSKQVTDGHKIPC